MTDEATDSVQLIGARVTFVPAGEGASYSLTEWVVEPGTQGPPIHIHHEHDEGFYVMSGHFGFVLDGVTLYGKPGTHVLVPKGHAHSFWNAGAGPAKLLHIVIPPGLDQYFRDLATALRGITTQEASIAVRKKLQEKHDIEIVGQPVPTPPSAGEG